LFKGLQAYFSVENMNYWYIGDMDR